MPPNPQKQFARRRRSLTTRASVRVADTVARLVIIGGGVSTIVAVGLVCVFLVWVAIPLFLPERMEAGGTVALEPQDLAAENGTQSNGTQSNGTQPNGPQPDGGATDLAGVRTSPLMVVEESGERVAILRADGTLRTVETRSGKVLGERRLFDQEPVAWSADGLTGNFVFAFPQATIQQGVVVLNADAPTAHARLRDPVQLNTDAGVLLIDQTSSGQDDFLTVLLDTGELRVGRISQTKNLLTGKTTSRLKQGSVRLAVDFATRRPVRLLTTGLGDNVFVVFPGGELIRVDSRQLTRPEVAETLDLIPEAERHLSAIGFLNGKSSLAVGDSTGRIQVWFRTRPAEALTTDGLVLTRAHELSRDGGAVTQFAFSNRSRMLAAAFATGQVGLYHATSAQLLTAGRLEYEGAISGLALAPKDDSLWALAGGRLARWNVSAPHPEVTLAALYLPVWYEGYDAPETVWQSSSGTDDFEPKYGLFPLIFGTLKATCYTMLFGVPIALLAAVYSSEFLDRGIKARVKPAIELMASLPSVVLGYFAGVILAPLVENIVPHLLTAFATIPFACLLGAYLAQLMPGTAGPAYVRRFRLLGVALAIPLGVWLAALLGEPVERWLFAGDIKSWLDQKAGGGFGAWVLLLLPLCGLLVAMSFVNYLNPWMQRLTGTWNRDRFARLDLVRFLVGCLLALALALAIAHLLSGWGWDPRGTWVGTYSQRNALIVGFVMGFAVIPIIYTIADDALTAVPDSLRAGSLGAGATPWQTALRVVIPTATSGLFSAVMVGLGRAVGETMIVVMSTGNTPTKNVNIFDGFRTLSANIATEIMESVDGSTHYRILFLTALNLFLITFVINTVAEVVRQRFRRRTYQL